MRDRRGLWILLLLLFMATGIFGCSGTKPQLKKEPNKAIAQTETAETSGRKETPIPGTASETSKIEKLTESRIPGRDAAAQLSTPPSLPPSSASTPPGAPVAPSKPSPTPPSLPSAPPEPRKGSGFVFNFDNADLYEVIRVMAEIMKMNYLIDPRVKGVVNIHTSGQILAGDVFVIFQSILKMNGATAVKRDGLYEIIPFSDAKKLSGTPSALKDPAESTGEKYTIQIIPLKYISATEASKLVKPFLSDGADIVEHPPNNILLIGDITSNVKKCLEILSLFDTDIFIDMKVRIYPIYNSDVNDIAKEMERIFASFELSTKSGRGLGITFTPVTRINSLLVISSIPGIFEKVEEWLRQLDKAPMIGTSLGVFVYYVQNGKAKDMADVMKLIFTPPKKTTTTTTTTSSTSTTPTTPSTQQRPTVRPTPPPATPGAPAPSLEEGVPTGEISIVVDEPTNALVFRCYPRDYKYILETIKKLDIYPKQVLIEVLLAEITLDDANQFGIEWARFTTSNPPIGQQFTFMQAPPADLFNQALGAANFRYSIVELGGKVAAAVNAAASGSRLKVISSPHIMASNNKEAKIQVGASQPILTNTYTSTAIGATGVVEGSIEYKDIGIILVVTPRISDSGLVTLDISVENSTANITSLGTLSNIPVFGKRSAKTTLSIMEGQTIVIGGLIEDTKNKTWTGIPILSKIPIIGAVFGYQTYDKKKTELILMMTPHVIADASHSNAVTREFRDKVEGLRKEIQLNDRKENK